MSPHDADRTSARQRVIDAFSDGLQQNFGPKALNVALRQTELARDSSFEAWMEIVAALRARL